MRRAAAILAALTLVRFLVAAVTPLSPDEAYYWTWSRALAPCYLDHPPMVAIAIRIGTALAGDDPLGVRLLSPILALFGSVLVAAAARDLLGLDRVGQVAAACLLNATLMVGAGAVTMTPDTPLLFFWTLALFSLGRMLRTGSDNWLVASGIAVGLAFDSKYTGALLVPSIALWLLVARRPVALLTAWRPALAAASCLLVAMPVIVWNARHGFASFAKQGGRAAEIHPADALGHLAELVGGQLGLATPLIAILFCAGVLDVTGRRRDPGASLLALATLLPAAIFVEHALGDRVQANWPSVLYPGAAIAAAACPNGRLGGWRAASLSGLALTTLVYAQAALHPLPLPVQVDVTLARFAGWAALSREVGRQGRALGLPVATDDYALAAELAWHRASGAVLATDRRWSFVDLPRTALVAPVLLVRSDRRHTPPDPLLWATATPVGAIVRGLGDLPAERYVLYRASAARTTLATRLPRPRDTPSPPLNPR